MQGEGYNPAYAGRSAAVVADAAAHQYHESQMEYRQQESFCCFPPLKSLFCCIPLRAALYVFAFVHIVGIFASLVISGSASLTSTSYWLIFSIRLGCFLFSIVMVGLVVKASQLPATETTVDILTACCFIQLIFCTLGYIISAICAISALVLVVNNPTPLNGIASGFLELELLGAGLLLLPACFSLHFAHVYWSYALKLRNQLTAAMLPPYQRGQPAATTDRAQQPLLVE
eukprot:GHVS01035063.1.p1 GENE.GHVS01035063.1~~GHVS01035063.1.p1  ORF type:complete len:230 (+),score=33.67 GHVS01035063.1:148-837(+)